MAVYQVYIDFQRFHDDMTINFPTHIECKIKMLEYRTIRELEWCHT